MKKALILVDIQNDFCTGGALAVKDGEKIIPLVNKMIKQKGYEVIVATQDFHPADHKSFASVNGKDVYSIGELNGSPQVMWPDHCVQGSVGAKFHPDLNLNKKVKVFVKGTNKEVDSYSGFFDNDKKSSTGMGEWLKAQGVTDVTIVGLALDFCVKATAIDAVNLGFNTKVAVHGTKAVNMMHGDDQRAIMDLIQAGVHIDSTKE